MCALTVTSTVTDLEMSAVIFVMQKETLPSFSFTVTDEAPANPTIGLTERGDMRE